MHYGKSVLRLASAAAALALFCTQALAQTYPSAKPIALIVPFAAGGVTDLSARIIAKSMSQSLGQTIIVENRAGAAGKTGTEAAARAQPDGYTLMVGNSGTHVVAALTATGYNPIEDFTFVAKFGEYPFVVVCNPKLDATDLKGLIALMRSKPDGLTFSNPGAAGQGHLLAAYLGLEAGGKVVHVPYRGGGPALQDVVAGSIDCTIDGTAHPNIEAGVIKAFAVTTAERDPRLPNVPTLKESGFKNYALAGWQSIMGPRNIPIDIVEKLATSVNKALEEKEVVDSLSKIGMFPSRGDAAELKTLVERELALYRDVAKKVGIVGN